MGPPGPVSQPMRAQHCLCLAPPLAALRRHASRCSSSTAPPGTGRWARADRQYPGGDDAVRHTPPIWVSRARPVSRRRRGTACVACCSLQ
ncbi:hypothetical protein NDU88_007490 [Pleurodeles waltl]|uniref:Uncharacterized protein n=1 Tax=Pleurodeles waltl TaxID=8319 RepID=A0AAV7QS30_PLEWA|nr:hypothetical protein NDU88_007490 [Pleurodeles waltl]